MSGALEPLVKYEPCPLTPVYYVTSRFRLLEIIKGLRTHEVVEERIVDDTNNRTAFIYKS